MSAQAPARLDTRAGLALALLALAAAALLGSAPAARAATCPNEAVRGETNSASLPDCRAYELVSPAYKEGYEFVPYALSGDGATLTGATLGTIAGTEQTTGPEGGFYSLTRGAAGWGALALSPPMPELECESFCFKSTSADGTRSLWVTRSEARPLPTIYRREADGEFVMIGPAVPEAEPWPVAPPGSNYTETVSGASADLSTVLLTNYGGGQPFGRPRSQEYWPGDSTVEGQTSHSVSLYEYTGTNNAAPVLVGVRGTEDSVAEGSTAELISQCGTELGYKSTRSNAVSEDGSVVFFTADSPASCEGVHGEHGVGPAVDELWARVDGVESVPISEPSEEACEACQTEQTAIAVTDEPAEYQGASADGSKVFFTTTQELLPGASGKNLYEYDFDAAAGRKVSLVSASEGGAPSEFGSVVQIADSGARVYYVAAGVLAGNENAEGETAQSGAGTQNLYVYDTQTGANTFVATIYSTADELQSYDACKAEGPQGLGRSLGTQCQNNLRAVAAHPSVTTKSGRFLVFVSIAHLTKDDTAIGPQVFEYDAVTGELARVSRGQGGIYNDDGHSVLASVGLGGGGISSRALPGVGRAGLSSVSEDGSRVFFASGAALTPGALDEDLIGVIARNTFRVFAENFYEYRSEGGIDHGDVSLIDRGDTALATGRGPLAELYGTDASGGDVFFSTTQALVGQDTDSQIDVYDARLDGGFPAPAPATGCAGEACQGAVSGEPPAASPLSAATAGGGNVRPRHRRARTHRHRRRHHHARRHRGKGRRHAKTHRKTENENKGAKPSSTDQRRPH